MSEVLVTGTLLSPLGTPVPNGIFRFTALRIAEEQVPSTEATHTTATDGSYTFNLKYGTHRMEVLVKDEYIIVANIVVNESTPSPIDISGLVQFGTVVEPPVLIPEDPDWVALHEDLRNSTHTSRRDVGAQVGEFDTHAASLKSIFMGDTAYMAEETQSIAKGITKLERTSNAYDDYAQQQSIIDRMSMQTRKGKVTHTTELYTSSRGTEEFYDKREYLGTDAHLKDNSIFDGSSITVERSVGYGTALTTEVHDYTAEGLSYEFAGEFTAEAVSIRFGDGYSLGVSTGVPFISCNHNTEYVYDLVPVTLIDEQQVWVDDNRNVHASQTKGVSVLARNGYDRIENNGAEVKRTVQSDITTYQGTDGIKLVTMDAVNNVMTVNGRLVITNPEDFQGPAGESRYQELQYSIDGLGGWDDVFDIEDKWRRHRDVINGIPQEWSVPYLLQAEDGSPGDTLYFEYNYAPVKTGPWTPMLKDDDIWRIERLVTNGIPSLWSAPARIRGFDGPEGWVGIEEYQYAENMTDPEYMWHSNFSTGDHWRRERLLTYFSSANYIADKPDIIGPWLNVTQIVPINGVDYGAKQTTIYLYQRKATQPALPSGPLTYNFDDLTLVPASNYNGWFYDIADVPTGDSPLWVAVATASTTTAEDVMAADEWAVTKWSANGLNPAILNLFCIYNGAGAPTLTFTSATQNLDTGAVTITGTNTYGWSHIMPSNTSKGGKLWVTTNVKLVEGKSAVHGVAEFTVPALFSQNGIDGKPGASGTDGADGQFGAGSYIWYRGSLTPTAAQLESFVTDYAGVGAAVKGTIVQVCNGTSSATTTDSQFWIRNDVTATSWQQFNWVVNGNAVIDGTLAARKLVARDITGDKISATTTLDVGTGNNVAKFSGEGIWRIWSGHTDATSAPFRVDQAGNVFMSNADVAGTIRAIDGELHNVVIAEDCQIEGTLYASQIIGAGTDSASWTGTGFDDTQSVVSLSKASAFSCKILRPKAKDGTYLSITVYISGFGAFNMEADGYGYDRTNNYLYEATRAFRINNNPNIINETFFSTLFQGHGGGRIARTAVIPDIALTILSNAAGIGDTVEITAIHNAKVTNNFGDAKAIKISYSTPTYLVATFTNAGRITPSVVPTPVVTSPLSPTPSSVQKVEASTAQAGFRILVGGNWETYGNGDMINTTNSGSWLVSGNAINTEVRVTKTGGTASLNSSMSSWVPVDRTHTVSIAVNSSPTAQQSASLTFTLEIRDATTKNVLSTTTGCSLSVTATKEGV